MVATFDVLFYGYASICCCFSGVVFTIVSYFNFFCGFFVYKSSNALYVTQKNIHNFANVINWYLYGQMDVPIKNISQHT